MWFTFGFVCTKMDIFPVIGVSSPGLQLISGRKYGTGLSLCGGHEWPGGWVAVVVADPWSPLDTAVVGTPLSPFVYCCQRSLARAVSHLHALQPIPPLSLTAAGTLLWFVVSLIYTSCSRFLRSLQQLLGLLFCVIVNLCIWNSIPWIEIVMSRCMLDKERSPSLIF